MTSSPPETRITLNINNKTSLPVICADISCEPIPAMYVGMTIPAGRTQTFSITTNNRVFCRFVSQDETVYELGMTSPKSSSNSAEGCLGNEGLQTYAPHADPVTFTYDLGSLNLADWNNGQPEPPFTPNNKIVAYGDC